MRCFEIYIPEGRLQSSPEPGICFSLGPDPDTMVQRSTSKVLGILLWWT